MKREIPILLTIVCGLLITWAFLAPANVIGPDGQPVLDAQGSPRSHVANAVNSELNTWALVLFSMAFLLGIANLVRINLKDISARHPDAVYKGILLVSLFAFLFVGLVDTHQDDLPLGLVSLFVPADTYTLADGRQVDGYLVSEDDGLVIRSAQGDVPVESGQITGTVDRSLKLWVYDKMFRPLQSTMFSLLAFYIASAAFRAFRARSLEATLLLTAGAVVMLGQVPEGTFVGDTAGRWQAFIMANINAAGQRAIIIGATLGVLATGLRIILGIERSYLSE